MFKSYYTIQTKHTNKFDIARFNLIWRFNYVLTLLFVLLNIFFVIQGDTDSLILFSIATVLTASSLIVLYFKNNFKIIYTFICCFGIILPALTLNFQNHIVHYGDIVWIIVAVCLSYFGLGYKTGKYFMLAGLLAIAVHIIFFLNTNLNEIAPLQLFDKIVLLLEISIAFFIVFYIIYQYTTLYSQSEKELTTANTELIKQNLEKELLLKEIHHRVKNNLQIVSSLLSLQSGSIENESALSALKEGQSRIKSMALLHQRLYQNKDDFSKLNFKDYVSELHKSIEKSHKNSKEEINTSINIENIYFDIDTAVPLGLIMNELITNSYKYAFNNGGNLTITIEKETNNNSNNNYRLIIKDSGAGIRNFDINNITTLGLKLVNMLSKQLKGNLKYEYENGTKFIISFIDKSKTTTDAN